MQKSLDSFTTFIQTHFNPLYSDGFSDTDKNNNDGSVDYIFKG